jgi:hypothetical protein
LGAGSRRDQQSKPNEQRVGALYGTGFYLGALCSTCTPTRNVHFTWEEIMRLGEADPLVRDGGRVLVCPHARRY